MTRCYRGLLALDLSQNATGWALHDEEGRLTVGIQPFKLAEGEHPGRRWPRVREWLRAKVTRQRSVVTVSSVSGMSFERSEHVPFVGLIAWEKIIPAGSFGGNARSVLYALEAQVVEVAAELSIETATVAPSSLKKVRDTERTREEARDASGGSSALAGTRREDARRRGRAPCSRLGAEGPLMSSREALRQKRKRARRRRRAALWRHRIGLQHLLAGAFGPLRIGLDCSRCRLRTSLVLSVWVAAGRRAMSWCCHAPLVEARP